MLVDFILHKANGTDTVELNKSIDGYSVVLNPKLHDVYNQVSYVEFDVAMSMDNYIEIGDWLEVDGKKYYSLTNFASFNARIAKGGTYNVRFYSPEQWLYKANMYATNEIYSGGVYSWERVDNTIVTVGNLESFGRWLCWNTNAQQNTRMFKLGNVPTGMNEQYEVLDFNPANCLSALYSICKTYKVRYEVVPNTEASPDSQYIINFYDTDEVFPVTFKYEEENGLYKLELTGCDEEVYTQFEIAGSTENIPSSYRDTRLRLSESISALSILDYPDLYDKWGRSIKILTYENIKPTRTGTVTDIVVDDIYSFIDSSLIGATWSPVGGTIQVVEGPLMGFSFECDYFNSANGRVHIKPMTESNGMELPSADLSYYRFTAGATPTRYNVVGIALPNEYIEDAEARLLAAAMNDTSYYSDIRASYSLAISGTLLEEGEYEINAGVLVPIQHLGIGLDRSVRVQSITYDLSKPKYYDIEEIQLSDFRQEGLMDMVTEGVRKSVATLKDVGYTNKLNTFANSVSTIKQGIAKSLGYESWEDFMEKTWNGEDGSWEPSTIIVDSLINSDLINVNTLIAREAFISTLLANELFISGVQDETESLVNNYLLYLTSSVATVSCDSEGTVTGTLPTSTAIVYHGASADTGWSFSGELSGCTGSVNEGTGVITITGLTADDSTVTVSATKTNKPTLQAVFRISKVYAGIDGEDGVTTYTWIKYADVSDGTGLYDTPTSNTLYIGIAVNKTTPTESTTRTDYTWSKFKGDQGVAGEDGATTYTWIKYASDSSGTGITDDPTGMTYIGFAYNKTTPTESTTPGDYTWSLIKGEQGNQGVQGPPGANGVTTYTWIKYSDNADGTGLYDTPTANTLYIGIAVNKTTATESTVKTDYVWSKFKGEQGVAGADGTTTYTWIKYADDAVGTGISDIPTGKLYIGLAHNKTTVTESSDPADYTWSLIKGTDGVDGIDGVDAVYYYLTPSVDAVIRSMDGTATPSTVSCAQYKIQGGGTPVAANKTIKYQRSIDGTMQTYSTAVAVSTSIYIDFYLYDGVTELWRTRVPVLHDLDEWESTLNDFAKGLGYTDTVGGDSAYEKLVGAALAGKTIMEGGYLRNSLIDTEHLIAHDAFINRIATNSLTIGQITDTAAALDDAIQVGGRNLIPFAMLYSSVFAGSSTKEITVSSWAAEIISNAFIKSILVPGETYTMSFVAELIARTSVPTLYNHNVSFYLYSPNGTSVSLGGAYLVNLNDKTTVKNTFVAPEITNHVVLVYTNRYTTNGNEPVGFDTVKFTGLKLEKGNKATDWTPAPEDVQAEIDANASALSDFEGVVTTSISGLQAQIDGVVDSWFYAYTPTTVNYPASEWTTTELRQRHIGDTFTNTQAYVDEATTPDAGKSWRWVESSGVYSWTPIADSDAVKALLAASTAQDTADGKRRVFTTTPTPPYDKDDLWSGGSSGDLKISTTSRAVGSSYVAGDWVLATKYTDDTAVTSLENALGELAYEDMVGKAKLDSTIIDGGYILTSLIDANTIAAGTLIVSAINDSVDAIQIGGRNLWLNSAKNIGLNWTASGIVATHESNGISKLVVSAENGNWAQIIISHVNESFEGKQLTISFAIRGEGTNGVKPTLYIGNSIPWYMGMNPDTTVTSEWQRIYLTFTMTGSFNLHLGWNGCVGTYYISKPKLEYGNKPTDWTPAPEDVQEDYATKFGYSSYSDLVAKAAEGLTIINGGYINTDLIEARSIVAGKIATGTITANEIEAGTITANEIKTGTITANKINISNLTTDSAFITAITAMTITADSLLANTAFLESLATESAFIEELIGNTAFISALTVNSLSTVDSDGTSVSISNSAYSSKAGVVVSGSSGSVSMGFFDSVSAPALVAYDGTLGTGLSASGVIGWGGGSFSLGSGKYTVGETLLELQGAGSNYFSISSKSSGNAIISSGEFSISKNELYISTLPTSTQTGGHFWSDSKGHVMVGAASAYTAADVGAVPTTRTVNSKALSANITLSASDVSAVPSTDIQYFTQAAWDNLTTVQKNAIKLAIVY